MNKEITKDYSIDAFRYYANQGKPTDAEIMNMCNISEAERKDLLSVQKVCRALDDTAKNLIDIIYFKNYVNELSTKNIKLWISDASMNTSIEEIEIRMILKVARLKFAIERGMRT